MKLYKKANLTVGWIVFAIAAFTYISTIESTASFWDCGEFITSAWKLEVGHPPGAPFFMMFGRIFTLFAFGDVTKVAITINILSAMASAFTILFLFWSITHIAKKIIIKSDDDYQLGNIIAIMGAGAVGALAYTFTDSFWFSAVEGEVYASSALFTSLVFWAILKWENVADQKGSSRWLIFIAYMMGLSIGVHLLNLLAIPAIVFIYYFRKYPVTVKGIIYTSVIAIGLLGIVQYVIIPGIPALAQTFELIFTNSFGLPYNTGTMVYLILLVGFIVWGIWYSHKKQKPLFNTIMVAFTVLVIGYSSYAMVIIRSSADTPMDQNDPENVFSLVSYLDREQYGDHPLAYGQYFNSRITKYGEGKPVYIQKNGKYEIAEHKVTRIFDPSTETVFPRMYSDQSSPPHIKGYIKWAGLNEADLYQPRKKADGSAVRDNYGNIVFDHNKPLKTPTFGQNLLFFLRYQIGYMYVRYFLWNFSGRQNDIQGHGEIQHGNWISGIPILDNARLGNQDLLPKPLKNNKARNKYYMLPLLLGLIGMYYMFVKNQRDFWVILLLFFMTGLAIILYLNQPPYQPRERDYAYAGSFYAFAMYIGLGVLMIIEWLKKISNTTVSAVIVSLVLLIAVPGVMAQQNWNDHDRSGRTTARDFAYNYLNSCAPNAILFTNGDNDTFPLWYAQEVEGIRRDVRVINLSYLNTDWYIDQMRHKAYESTPIPFSLNADQTERGSRDAVYYFKQNNVFIGEKYKVNKQKYQNRYQSIYQHFVNLLEKSNFPQKQAKDFAKLNTVKPAFTPDIIAGLMTKLTKYTQTLNIDNSAFKALKSQMDEMVAQISQEAAPLASVIKFIGDNSKDTKVRLQDNKMHNFLPTRNFVLPVNKNVVLANHVVEAKDSDKITDIKWRVNRTVLRKADLMVLDLLATNNWKRPIYFALTVGPNNYLGLENYFQLEGLAYRVVPIKTASPRGQAGRVATNIMYENLMHKFRFNELRDSNVYFDENNTRMMMNIRNTFTRLANGLTAEGKKNKAVEVLDFCSKLLPNSLVAYNYYNVLMAQSYQHAGAFDKAKDMIRTLADNSVDELNFYLALDKDKAKRVGDDRDRAIAIMYEIRRIANAMGDKEFAKEINTKFDNLAKRFSV